MSDTSTVVDNTQLDTRSWLRKQIEELPPIAHTFVVVTIIAFVGYLMYSKGTTPSVVNVLPAPILAQAENPIDVKTATRIHPARNLLLDVVRHRTKKCLMTDGFNLIGKDSTKLTAEQADKLLSQIDNDTLMEGMQAKGLAPEGTILDKLSALIDWLLSHEDQIMKLVKFFMSLLMLFP